MLDALVIGAGPAGLMAAEELAKAGRRVLVVDAMATPARKFLMAGKSGLNITKDQPFAPFVANYLESPLAPMLRDFGPSQWHGSGPPVGASSRLMRVVNMKAANNA